MLVVLLLIAFLLPYDIKLIDMSWLHNDSLVMSLVLLKMSIFIALATHKFSCCYLVTPQRSLDSSTWALLPLLVARLCALYSLNDP